jgi:large subunit ribosomal protein L23
MINPSSILKESIVTEKATVLSSNRNQYSFEVFRDADKKDVAAAVEQMFKVSVTRVNIINTKPVAKRNRQVPNQMGKKPARKKAIVTLKQGDAIELA